MSTELNDPTRVKEIAAAADHWDNAIAESFRFGHRSYLMKFSSIILVKEEFYAMNKSTGNLKGYPN